MTPYEIVSIIFSIVSFAGSLWSLHQSKINSSNINILNMRNNYFDVVKKDLTETIPDLCSKFISDESSIVNDDIGNEFEKYIGDFRKKIKFIKYLDKNRFQKLDDLLVKLEEEIILLPTRNDNKKEHINTFNTLIFEIYEEISHHFS